MAKKPASFNDLLVSELKRTAEEDFAVDLEGAEIKEEIIAVLTESGITWEDYLAQHQEHAPSFDEKVQANKAKEAERKKAEIHLIKMNRDNSLFEAGPYKFTSDHPFALVTKEWADYLLNEEVGFAIASPIEAEKYYS